MSTKISELDAVVTIDTADLVAIVDVSAGQTKSATVEQIRGDGLAIPGSDHQVLFNDDGALGASPMITIYDDYVAIGGDDAAGFCDLWVDELVIAVEETRYQAFQPDESNTTNVGSGRGPYFRGVQTTNATPTLLWSLAGSFFTGEVTLDLEIAVCHATGRGALKYRGVIRRNGGTFETVVFHNMSDVAEWSGTVVGAVTIGYPGAGTTIEVYVEGLAATLVNWTARINLVVAQLPT